MQDFGGEPLAILKQKFSLLTASIETSVKINFIDKNSENEKSGRCPPARGSKAIRSL